MKKEESQGGTTPAETTSGSVSTGHQIQQISRRDLLSKGTSLSLAIGILGTTHAVSATIPSSSRKSPTSPQDKACTSSAAVTQELSYDAVPAPKVTEYETDILIVGAGFAGIPAALEAKGSGKSVLVVDKGYPGYSGCSPFPQCYQFFNEGYGDSREAQVAVIQRVGEYIANLDWYDVYLNESKECFDQLVEWGIYKPFPKASSAGYYAENRVWDYHNDFEKFDRRARWNQLLSEKGVNYVHHTMVTDVIKNEQGRVIGALGLHVPSGTVITFHAKAVVLCNGGGSYKSAGWPTSGDTFDNEWIGYQAGAAIAGKEFSYIMATSSIAPGCSWRNYSWGYLENLHAVGGTVGMSDVEAHIKGKISYYVLGQLNNIKEGTAPTTSTATSKQPLDTPKNSTNKSDPRLIGNDCDDMPVRNVGGAAIGKGIHKCDGIFCGISDLVGYSGIPGLYAAGDALASMMYGAFYSPGQGGSTVVSHIQGRRAARAAVRYVETVPSEKINAKIIAEKSKELLVPRARSKGFNPYWTENMLLAVMSPYWVDFYKTEASLRGALQQVLELQTHVIPQLLATNAHELRLCHEVKHKVLSAEIKLRESLERKESRGFCQRSDYPYRDDKNFLCYITARKGANGAMLIERVPIKDNWKGDTSLPHQERYNVLYPGEAVALGLKG